MVTYLAHLDGLAQPVCIDAPDRVSAWLSIRELWPDRRVLRLWRAGEW